MDRIQKIIANSGYCSRRKAEELIVKGKVMVNGEIVKELGFKANMNDLIDTKRRIYPVGRLDYDTTGVLILTNDGNLANILTHPSNNIEKVYVAKLEGIITKDDIKKLEKGVVIDNKKTSPCKAKITKIDKKNNKSIVKLIIHEGRNHQVKKMFNVIGFDVIKLKRESVAHLTCDGVKSGEYRELSIKEVKTLYSLTKKSNK